MKPIDPARLEQLNQGLAECKTLTELVAVNFDTLLAHLLPNEPLLSVDQNLGITKRMQQAGITLHAARGLSLLPSLQKHPSDLVRGAGCYLITAANLPLEQALHHIKPFAQDPNAGVREWAWLALRSQVAADSTHALELLQPWTHQACERLRRFACEITRPRGVWCNHITELRQEPWLALPLLEQLKTDPTRYVQLSVGNWLNDASKDHPTWVTQLCAAWSKLNNPATEKICKRALRTLMKKQ